MDQTDLFLDLLVQLVGRTDQRGGRVGSRSLQASEGGRILR